LETGRYSLQRPIRPRNRTSYFAHLIEALHRSGRLQASFVIRQHGHLLHEDLGHEARKWIHEREPKRECPDVLNEIFVRSVIDTFAKTMLIATVMFGFGILHIMGGASLRYAPATRRPKLQSL
jgi:hypothetical protein